MIQRRCKLSGECRILDFGAHMIWCTSTRNHTCRWEVIRVLQTCKMRCTYPGEWVGDISTGWVEFQIRFRSSRIKLHVFRANDSTSTPLGQPQMWSGHSAHSLFCPSRLPSFGNGTNTYLQDLSFLSFQSRWFRAGFTGGHVIQAWPVSMEPPIPSHHSEVGAWSCQSRSDPIPEHIWNGGRGERWGVRGLFQLKLMRGKDKSQKPLAAILLPWGKNLKTEPKEQNRTKRWRQWDELLRPTSIRS